jgi:tRNA pseudouridine55 synthase
MNGALIVDKPKGLTSHDVVARARLALQLSRVGHTGTLDPLATGVLVLLVGRATRLSQFLVSEEKEYIADVRLGAATETYDAESRPALLPMPQEFTIETVEGVLDEFRGTSWQIPPPYSAKKIAGTRAYERARRHEHVELRPVQVTAHELELLQYVADGLVRLRVLCSAGYYVRALAHDIGQRLGCGAHLEGLRRTRSGCFSVLDATSLDEIETLGPSAAERLEPMHTLLEHLPALTLSEEGARRVGHGNTVAPHHVIGGLLSATAHPRVRLIDTGGALLAVAERGADALLHPLVVLL